MMEIEKIKWLNDVYKRKVDIGNEYYNHENANNLFSSTKGSFDNYIYETYLNRTNLNNQMLSKNPLYILFSLHHTLLNLKSELNTLNDLKKSNTQKLPYIAINNYLSQINGCFDYLKSFNLTSIEIKNKIDEFIYPWILLCQKQKIDISPEINTMELYKQDLINLDKIKNLSIRLETLIPALKSLEILTNDNDKENMNDDEIMNIIEPILSDEYQDAISFLHVNKIPQLIENMNNVFKNIKSKIVNNNISLSNAEEYIMNESKESSIINFITKKQTDNIYFSLEMGENNTFIAFKDNSLLFRKDNTIITPKDNTEASLILKNVFDHYMTYALRKNPTLLKIFNKEMSENNGSNYNHMASCIIVINNLHKNQNVLKAGNFNINESFKRVTTVTSIAKMMGTTYPNHDIFEKIDDEMNVIIAENTFKKYANSIASNKYNYLYDSESYEILKEIYDLNIEKETLQQMIGKKLAVFKSSSDFNSSLKKLLNSFSHFTMEDMTIKANEANSKIISNENNRLIVKIDNFEQNQLLGSSSWCISRQDYYYYSYTADNNSQYFIYDFNKDSKDNESMVGLTLKQDGTFHASAKKNDDEYPECSFISDLQLTILSKEINSYPLIDKSLYSKIKNNLSQDKLPKYI